MQQADLPHPGWLGAGAGAGLPGCALPRPLRGGAGGSVLALYGWHAAAGLPPPHGHSVQPPGVQRRPGHSTSHQVPPREANREERASGAGEETHVFLYQVATGGILVFTPRSAKD